MAEKDFHGRDLTAPASGLAISALVAFLTLPVLHGLSWIGLLARTAWSILLAFLVCAGIMAGVYAFQGRTPRDARYLILRISSAAAWLPPLLLFMAQRSLWAVAAAVAMTAFLIRLARYRLQTEVPRRFYLLLLASACFEAGAIMVFVGRPVTGAALSGIGAGILTWRVTPESERNPRNWAMIGLALFLMAGGLTRYLRAFPGGDDAGDSQQSGDAQGESAARATDGDYTGVILLPEVEERRILAPPQPTRADPRNTKISDPLSIPFDGAYWYFMAPDRQPPPDSLTTHGDPSDAAYLSPSRKAIVMEAHQNFGRLIDVGCCSAIEIAIRNRDRYFATTGLELVLVNSALAGRPAQSLGTVAVRSIPRSGAVEETLTFPVPSSPRIRQFDEVTIRFHLAGMRGERSAKIAIEKFVLVPRRF